MLTKSRAWAALIAVLLAAGAALAYRPSLSAGFVYDDEAQILWDGFIHDRANLRDVLTLRVLARDVLDFNRPANLLSLMLDSAVWGRNPFGYHFTNVLLHSGVVALLFFVLLDILARATKDPPPRSRNLLAAAFGAALFAVHPLTVEPVASPGFREDLLATLFTLLALALAARFREPTPLRRLIGASIVAACFAAVASKESGAAAPAILLAYVLAFRRGEDRRAWTVVIVASGIAVALFLALRFWLEPATSLIFADRPAGGQSLQTLLKLQPRIWAGQLNLIVWPTWLCADYGIHCLRHLPLVPGWIVIASAVAGMAWLSRRTRVAAFAGCMYLAAILPVSNFVPIYIPMADRYMYMPLAAAAILAAWVIHRALAHRIPAVRLGTVAAALLAALLLLRLTTARVAVWQSDLALWSDTWARNPRSALAANNLAGALFKQGRDHEALTMCDNAINLSRGRSADPWYQRSMVLRRLGKNALADEAAQRAKALDYRYRDPALMHRALLSAP